MHVRFAAPELKQIDALRCEALALPFFSDERPLRGPLGLVDWRMRGFVSRLLVQGKLRGAALETVLIPGRPKLSMDKLFLFGLGPQAGFDTAQLERVIDHMLNTLSRAHVRTTALVLPGRSTHFIGAGAAMEAFVTNALHRDEHDEIIVLEAAEAQKQMEPVVEHERRRARALLP
jgi:hypothetical protein